ncbi:MAG TPA: hypothetical protein VKP89_04350 [Burkholderiales bacterium]|nr:hypothetical protein [Burkholderiales bacterium]
MTIRHSIDVAGRASPALARLIDKLLERETGAPETLAEVRAVLRARGGADVRQTEFLHPRDEESLLVELDRLIDEFGNEARAQDFVAKRASEALSRIIEAAMNDPALPRYPTLGAVREAMTSGLAARLVGEGVLDEDEEIGLVGEIDELIERHGEGAPAESLIRFE